MLNTKYRRLIIISSFTVVIALLFFTSSEAIIEVFSRVTHEDRYSHVPLVLVVSFYLIWIRRHEINNINKGAWLGVPIIFMAGLLLLIGNLSAIWTIVQYALILSVVGLIWTLIGYQTKKIAIPLLLFFMSIPLPYMLDIMLTGKMQLISSQLGVFIVRLLDIPVYLEGNVIDLGQFKLQVVEACSGLNYMFPLMTLGLIIAYIFIAPVWIKIVIFFSTMPITIFMNSFRIALVAALVNQFGIESAEGFMHYFEGWIIFMICVVLLLAEIKIYNLMSHSQLSVIDSLDINPISSESKKSQQPKNFSSTSFVVGIMLILLIILSTLSIEKRDEIVVQRQSFINFPMQINKWVGISHPFFNNENSILKLSDYILADYNDNNNLINLYIGYVKSQRKGFVPHSPKACIPGGGWEINDTSIKSFKLKNGKQLSMTRLLIKRSEQSQIIYYWFRQRGRDLSNEYSMKLALVYDAIKINRTDGAIIRFSIPVNSSIEKSEAKLQEFIDLVYPNLPLYIPD